ncbi:MAG: hypothetical protein M1839_002216 [Geoglossum umbratile]|nr:MAG: hypothetical protein M1839_002216 [Geoglossum umbratile]
MVRKAPTAIELLRGATARGYQVGAHREKDTINEGPKYVKKTLRDQNWALSRYAKWIECVEIEKEGEGEESKAERVERAESARLEYCFPKGAPCPDLATTKDFLRFHIALSQGRIRDKTTVDSVNTFAEWFFAGFTRVTGTVISEEYRSSIYNWVRTALTEERLIVNTKKPKHLFGRDDLIRFHTTFWTMDDEKFIHPRNKLQIPFIIDVFCWTGARIGAFFPSPDNKNEGGLRYKDIEVVLLRADESWKVIYRIDQRWVKNNRDPENITYGASTSQHTKLIFDDTQYLLALAFADKAFYEIDSPEKFWQLQIPKGEKALILRWEDAVKNLPILRNATLQKGVSETPLPRVTFERIVRSVMRMSGYFGYATVHAIRRYLGKKLNERYTETERSQHITQNDPRVYGQSYTANTTSCDGRQAFLDEAAQHDHVEYFQGFSKFCEKGLPHALPAEKKAALENDPQIIELRDRVQQLETEGASAEDIRGARNKVRSCRNSLERATLRVFQNQWVKDQRDWKIRTQGKEQAEDLKSTELVQTLSRIIPERGRLTKMMLSDKVISKQEREQAVTDLYSFITRDYTVLYRPGEEPINGTSYLKNEERLTSTIVGKKSMQILFHVCSLTWYIAFSALLGSSKGNGGPIAGSILIQLVQEGNETLSAEKRLQEWNRDADLMPHLENHVSETSWPSGCPHPLCNLQIQDETSFWYHLNDAHNLRRGNIKGRKRSMKDDISENSDSILFKQSESSHGAKKKRKSMQSKETLGIKVTDYSPPKLSPTSADGRRQEQPAIFTDPVIAPTMTSLSSVPDLSYSPDSCLTGNGTLEGGGYYNIDDFDKEIPRTELGAGPGKLTDIMMIDLTGDSPLIPDDPIFRYTAISSTCPSIKGDSDDDSRGLSTCYNQAKRNKDVQIIAREPSTKLRLNPPKGPKDSMPKISLRVKQPDQVPSRTRRHQIGKDDRRVRYPAPTTKKPRRKRYA